MRKWILVMNVKNQKKKKKMMCSENWENFTNFTSTFNLPPTSMITPSIRRFTNERFHSRIFSNFQKQFDLVNGYVQCLCKMFYQAIIKFYYFVSVAPVLISQKQTPNHF